MKDAQNSMLIDPVDELDLDNYDLDEDVEKDGHKGVLLLCINCR